MNSWGGKTEREQASLGTLSRNEKKRRTIERQIIELGGGIRIIVFHHKEKRKLSPSTREAAGKGGNGGGKKGGEGAISENGLLTGCRTLK